MPLGGSLVDVWDYVFVVYFVSVKCYLFAVYTRGLCSNILFVKQLFVCDWSLSNTCMRSSVNKISRPKINDVPHVEAMRRSSN